MFWKRGKGVWIAPGEQLERQVADKMGSFNDRLIFYTFTHWCNSNKNEELCLDAVINKSESYWWREFDFILQSLIGNFGTPAAEGWRTEKICLITRTVWRHKAPKVLYKKKITPSPKTVTQPCCFFQRAKHCNSLQYTTVEEEEFIIPLSSVTRKRKGSLQSPVSFKVCSVRRFLPPPPLTCSHPSQNGFLWSGLEMPPLNETPSHSHETRSRNPAFYQHYGI